MQRKLTVLFAFAIFVLVLGWAITPAQAHCNGDMEHEKKHKNCPDGGSGGGGEPPMTPDTVLQWGGGIVETKSRTCVASQVVQNGSGGFYVCGLDTQPVHYPPLGVAVPTKRSNELCEVFNDINGIDLTPDRLYGYNWSDNCEEGGMCTIHINNWFSNDHNNQVTEATGGSFIRLRGFAEATGPFKDANPFVDSLMLNVDEINIIFYAAGSNKKLAECVYSPTGVTFQTDPLPTP